MQRVGGPAPGDRRPWSPSDKPDGRWLTGKLHSVCAGIQGSQGSVNGSSLVHEA